MNGVNIHSQEESSIFFASDTHAGASDETDNLLRVAFRQFPQFKREHGLHIDRAALLGDLTEDWLIENKPLNSYKTYERFDVMQLYREILSGVFDDNRKRELFATVGNHDRVVLPEFSTAEDAKNERQTATEELRKFLKEPLINPSFVPT